MSGAAVSIPLQSGAAPDRLGAADLAELLGAFNEVTGKLQVAHDQLTSEVSRLRRQLREADEQLQRSRRLAALGEMAAGIAHEIRNPLGSIGLYARMLSEDLGDRPQERDVARKIGRAVRGLDAIVTDVLAFAGESSLRIGRVSAEDLLASAVEHAGIASSPGGIRAAIELPQGDFELEADEGKLRQALINLIRNGVEAVEEATRRGWSGEASVRVLATPVGGPGGGSASLAVRDTGTGLHDGVSQRMFNPFFTTREAGTGLGLAIVHRIIDAHGGRINVSNNGPRMGDGATVEMVIPRRRTNADGPEAEQREAQG